MISSQALANRTNTICSAVAVAMISLQVKAGNMADSTLTFLTDRIVVAGPDGPDTLFFVNLIAFADQTYDVPTPGITLI